MKNKLKIFLLALTSLTLCLTTFTSINLNNKTEETNAIETQYKRIHSLNEMTWDEVDEYYFVTCDITENSYSFHYSKDKNKWAGNIVSAFQEKEYLDDRGFSDFHIVKAKDKYLIYEIVDNSKMYLCSDNANSIVYGSTNIEDARHWSMLYADNVMYFQYKIDNKTFSLMYVDSKWPVSPFNSFSGLWALDDATYRESPFDSASRLDIYKKIKNYKVTFDANGGSESSSQECEGFQYLTFPNNLSRDGYTFNGFNTKADGSGTHYDGGKSYQINGNLTLYAEWLGNTYTVNLNTQGGFGGSQSVTATYGKDMPKIELPYKSGFEFLGYYLSIDGGKQYYNADGSSSNVWDKTEGATLYAHWEFIGVNTAMKLAFNYVNNPNSSNVFRLMCAVDEATLSKVASSQHIVEYGIYIKKEDNFVARFDLNKGSAVINNEFIEKADIYKEGDYKYILIDLGDLLGEDKDNVNVTYTVHSYLKTGDVIDVSTKQSSYSFTSLLDAYLSMPEYKDNASLLQCKTDLGLN